MIKLLIRKEKITSYNKTIIVTRTFITPRYSDFNLPSDEKTEVAGNAVYCERSMPADLAGTPTLRPGRAALYIGHNFIHSNSALSYG